MLMKLNILLVAIIIIIGCTNNTDTKHVSEFNSLTIDQIINIEQVDSVLMSNNYGTHIITIHAKL